MKPTFIVAFCCSVAILSCSHPEGISMQEYSALTAASRTLTVPKNMTFTLRQTGETPIILHASNIRAGKSFLLSQERELIYPVEYSPADSLNGNVPTPSTPREFKKENVGLRCDLTASIKGSLILIEGTITNKRFEGFSKMGGELGQPILEGRHILTENRVELPKLTTYTTPVYVAIKPNSSETVEINGPAKSNEVTLSFAETP
jgi:hypothetical protein